MRTVIVLAIGLISLAAILLLVRYADGDAGSLKKAAIVFVAAWLVVILVSFRGGLRAGYSVVDEVPIHLLLFDVPALAAYLAIRWLVER